MKRFFMCCIVVIVALFLGFTAYYFIANKEKITLASETSSSIKLNVGETLSLNDVIKHELPSSSTVINVSFSVEGVLSYSTEQKLFIAEKVGSTVVTLTPSNTKFGPFVLNANVGDGKSIENPYYIRTVEQLSSIGKSGGDLKLDMHYELVSDLYLTNVAWTPIAQDSQFTGTFDGGNHVIYDMTINQNATYAGLFAKTAYGTVIENIVFVNANISGEFTYAGVVVGHNMGTVALCHVLEANITNAGNATGGIVGYNEFTQQTNGGVSARVGMCGIENSSITASGDVGGIVGANKASIVENCFVVLDQVSGSTTGKFGGIVGNNMGYKGTFNKTSTIYKSYAYVKSITDTVQTSGISAINTDADSIAANNYVYNLFVMDTSKMIGSESAETAQVAKHADASALKNKETYQTWDFNTVWQMGKNYAVINFESPYTTSISETVILPDNVYPDTPEVPGTSGGNTGGGSSSGSSGGSSGGSTIMPGIVGNTITSSNVWQVLKEIHDNPSSGKVYTFNTSFTVNLSAAPSGYTDLFPLGTKEQPFTCTIAPPSTQKITFTNLSVNGKPYASLFGYVGTGAAISGIVVRGAQVVGDSSTNVGVIASDVQSGATVANCVVDSATLTGSGNIGFIVGYNNGSAIGHTVKSSVLTANAQSNAGGIIGFNNATVLTSTSQSNTIIVGSRGNYGGIVGYNGGLVNFANAESVFIDGKTAQNVMAGVIAGQNSKTISNSDVVNSRVEVSIANNSCYVGGLTAINGGSLSTSSVLNTELYGYYVGGLAAINRSNIQQCTAGENHTGVVCGIYAGGLVSINATNGKITNSLVGTQMKTTEGSQRTAGFAYKLEGDSVIKNCFSYAYFSGNDGYLYCESETPFRNYLTNLWQNTPFGEKMGIIENSLVYNVSNTKIFGSGLLWEAWDPNIDDQIKAVQVTEAQAKGSDNWEKFHSNGFDFSIWKRTTGQYLSLY